MNTVITVTRDSGVVYAVKLYPAGATTDSKDGVADLFGKCLPVLEEMVKHNMPLLVHGEVTDPEVDIFDRERAGALDKLKAFTSFNGPDFYGLPRNTSKIKLIKSQWKVPESLSYATGEIIPIFAGETLEWLPSSV
ncbi:hypothetical protein LOK49_LG07G02187 [Camellia lanceoleosa]|uniref:Uncharacterized protein n=1 Tax=Camellia lanceoleosa TaxID=1840588 RepID=A0ACC0GWQ8_9ERIC|nr:hypothetical protein LOK49_LG07G02187 [Camellia lanceoleosa]